MEKNELRPRTAMWLNTQLVNLNLCMLWNVWVQSSSAVPGTIKQEWSTQTSTSSVWRQRSSHCPFCQDASAEFSHAQPGNATKRIPPPQIIKKVLKRGNAMFCWLFLSKKELFVFILDFHLSVLLWVHFAKRFFFTLQQEKWGLLLKSWKPWSRWLDGF